ncbi:hypothetical protein JW921_01390 [Candidatus Fermentibacterales bacterium]|nr:hypothetical protein [Candidatus Fermentibacterales bacterium]
MPTRGAFEVRHEGRIYRAADMEALMSWARDRRIAVEDEVRPAGTTVWKSVRDFEELARLLDPAQWWKITMGDTTYKAPDFETVVAWSQEGRITTDAVIEGPRTPPGGIRADALPRLASSLRSPGEGEDEEPPRIRFDGREYCPGDLDTLREWITDSRVPTEAELSIAGRPWEPIAECGLFEPELWPAGAWGEEGQDEEPAPGTRGDFGTAEPRERKSQPGAPSEKAGAGVRGTADGSSVPGTGALLGGPIVVRTLTEEITLNDPRRLAVLYGKRRVQSYDMVSHPDLPDGECTVAAAMEMMGLRATRGRWWIWLVAALLGLGAGFLMLDPFQLL